MAFDPGDPRITAFGLWVEAHRALLQRLERDRPSGDALRPGDLDLVIRLARSPGRRLRMADLAAQVGLSPSGLTRAVDRLSRGGWLERQGCPEDARGWYAALTDAGYGRFAADMEQHLAALDEHFFGVLSAAEIRQLEGIARKLRDHHNPRAAQISE